MKKVQNLLCNHVPLEAMLVCTYTAINIIFMKYREKIKMLNKKNLYYQYKKNKLNLKRLNNEFKDILFVEITHINKKIII